MSLALSGLALSGLPPLVSPQIRLLILGSFPSAMSLKTQQYYGNPRNQFWPLLQAILPPSPIDMLASSYQSRSNWLLSQRLGLWDVYASCERVGSLDSNIQHAVANDVPRLLQSYPDLQAIAFNGSESFKLAKHLGAIKLPLHRLPSSSPANAAWSFERKLAAWREVFNAHALITD